jgi:hypothetical protein
MNEKFAALVLDETVKTNVDPIAEVFNALGVTVVCVDDTLIVLPVTVVALILRKAVIVPVDNLPTKLVNVMANGTNSIIL